MTCETSYCVKDDNTSWRPRTIDNDYRGANNFATQFLRECKPFENQFVQEYNWAMDRKIVEPIIRVENGRNFHLQYRYIFGLLLCWVPIFLKLTE